MKPKPFAFVLMPFAQEFDDIYQVAIKPACKNAGAYAERVDEQIFFEGNILERIYNQITKADLIIADLTGKNVNVFYETGYAHALGKPTILITKNADDIPFDFKHYPHVIHGGSLAKLKSEIERRVKLYIENRKDILENILIKVNGIHLLTDTEIVIPINSYLSTNFDMYRHGSIGEDESSAMIGFFTRQIRDTLRVKITVQNTLRFEAANFTHHQFNGKFSLICQNDFIESSDVKIELDNGYFLHLYGTITILPGSSKNMIYHLQCWQDKVSSYGLKEWRKIISKDEISKDIQSLGESHLIIRIFLESGDYYKDYPFKLISRIITTD